MTELAWDQPGEREYETGVEKGVLYLPTGGVYNIGHAWNGLTNVTESPSGAEPSPQYADNTKYLNLISVEEFGGTIEAFTYPDEFGQCDGTQEAEPGVLVAQQIRRPFGLSYRSLLGNDLEATEFGFKLHLVYGALAAPSEKAYSTVNETPEPVPFSWEFSTTPVPVTDMKPSSLLVINSTKVDSDAMDSLLEELYGTDITDPRLPLPDEVIALFGGSVTEVTATAPTWNATTGVATIPSVTGVRYRRADTNAVVTGTTTAIASGASIIFTAETLPGYVFSEFSDDDWSFTRT